LDIELGIGLNLSDSDPAYRFPDLIAVNFLLQQISTNKNHQPKEHSHFSMVLTKIKAMKVI